MPDPQPPLKYSFHPVGAVTLTISNAGDTLIIETKGFNGYTRLDTNGHPHSHEMVMTNTFLRTDSNTMQHTVTVHDPKTYTQDWMNVRTWRIKPYPDVIMEYSCEENNKDFTQGHIKRPAEK